jgi:Glycosyltransferase family 87
MHCHPERRIESVGCPSAAPTDGRFAQDDKHRPGEKARVLESVLVKLPVALVAVLLLVLAAASAWSVREQLQPEHALNHDIGQEYLLARALADGLNPYLPIRDLASRYLAPTGLLDKPFATPHPPTAGVLFMPLLAVQYPTAVELWAGVELFSLILTVVLAIRLVGLPARYPLALVLAFALLGWTPVAVELALVQLTLAIGALMAAAELALLKRHDALGGALLGLSLALKPIAWPWLLVLAFQRKLSAITSAIGVLAVLVGVVVWRVGAGPVIEYLTQVAPSVSAAYATEPTNISLSTLVARLMPGAPAAHLIGVLLTGGLVVLALGWCAVARPSLRRALAVMTCVSIVASPIAWEYDLVLLIVPATEMIAAAQHRTFPLRWTVLLVAIGMALYLPISLWHSLIHVDLGPTLLVLGIAGLLAATAQADWSMRNPQARFVRHRGARPSGICGADGSGASHA